MACMHCERVMGGPMPPRCKVPPEWVDRYAFMRSLPQGLTVAELGVYNGDFSEMLLKFLEPKLDVMVDFWTPYGTPRIKPLETQGVWDARYEKARSRFADQVECNQVQIYRETFSQNARRHSQEKFDFIHHDGDKTSDHVYWTLADWWPLLKQGGYWMGKDFAVVIDNGVIPGVLDFLKTQQDATFLGITRADWSPSYILRKEPA